MTVLDPQRARMPASTRRIRAPRPPTRRLELPEVADPLAPRLARPPRAHPRPLPWERLYLRRLLILDAVVGGVAGLAAAFLRFEVDLEPGYDLLTVVFPALWVVSLSMGGGYERRHLGQSGGEEYRGVGRGAVALLALLAIFALVATVQLSRIFVGAAILLAVVGSLLVRKLMRTWVVRRRRKGLMAQRVVVVGRADAVAGLIRSMKEDLASQGLLPVAACASGLDRTWAAAQEIEGVPVAGAPTDAVEVVDLVGAEAVVVSSHPDLGGHALRRLS